MAYMAQNQASKKKGGKVTIENFYGGNNQGKEEKEDEIQTKSKHAPQKGNYPQALEELKLELIQKVETFWQEKWGKKKQKEVSSLTDKTSQLEKELEAFNRRADQAEKQNQSLKTRIKQLEDSELAKQQELIKQSQKINELEENIKYLTDKVTDQGNRGRRDNLRIIVLPEKPEINKKNLNDILQEIIEENCPNVLEQGGKIEIERVHKAPSILNPQKTTPRNVITKFKSFQSKEKILQEAKKRSFRYRGAPISITHDLAASMLRDHKAWNMIRKARELGLQPRINYPSKLIISFQGKVWAFNKIEDFQVFAKKRPELNGKFEIQSQRARKTRKGKYEKKEKEKNLIFFFKSNSLL
uniref:L1 transposable element RRM domain-containing protein n=1 Tax=Monodelphis domestica TaxID=13616 RepID=A0A5F8GDP0_MONDO